jgi:hypothetical protein
VSWTQNSKPPVVPMPGIAGGATGSTIASLIFCASPYMPSSTARAFLRLGRVERAVALLEVLERHEERAGVGLVALSIRL